MPLKISHSENNKTKQGDKRWDMGESAEGFEAGLASAVTCQATGSPIPDEVAPDPRAETG